MLDGLYPMDGVACGLSYIAELLGGLTLSLFLPVTGCIYGVGGQNWVGFYNL